METILAALGGLFAIAALMLAAKLSTDYMVCCILLIGAYAVSNIILIVVDELIRDNRKVSDKI